MTSNCIPEIYRAVGSRQIVVSLPRDAEPPAAWWLEHLPARARKPRWNRNETWSISMNHLEATEAALLCEFGTYRSGGSRPRLSSAPCSAATGTATTRSVAAAPASARDTGSADRTARRSSTANC